MSASHKLNPVLSRQLLVELVAATRSPIVKSAASRFLTMDEVNRLQRFQTITVELPRLVNNAATLEQILNHQSILVVPSDEEQIKSRNRLLASGKSLLTGNVVTRPSLVMHFVIPPKLDLVLVDDHRKVLEHPTVRKAFYKALIPYVTRDTVFVLT